MNRSLIATVFFLCLISPALAGSPWYYPRQSAPDYVNPFLGPERALGNGWQSRWEGQLVLWQGVASHVKASNPQSLVLTTSSGQSVQVQFSRSVKNLQANREGAVLGIKGYLRHTASGKLYLEGRSVIPWSPVGGFKRGTPLVKQWIEFSRPELSLEIKTRIARAIMREAASVGIDPLFLTSLIQVESGFDPNAVSVSGAQGLGQLMPATAAGLGVAADSIEGNVGGCAKMIGRLIKRYSFRPDGNALALASYNAGPNLVAKIQKVPAYEQTVNYVYFIGSLHQHLSAQQKAIGGAAR